MQQIMGVMVGIIFIVAYIPQLKNLYRYNDVSGISTIFWLFIGLATFITFENLYANSAVWYVIIPQALNAFIALVILTWVVIKKYKEKQLIFTAILFIVLYFLIIAIDSTYYNYLQNMATILMILAYFIQLAKLIKSKNTNGLSIDLFVGIEIALGIMIFNILTTGAPFLSAITELVNLIMIALVIIFTLKYRKGVF